MNECLDQKNLDEDEIKYAKRLAEIEQNHLKLSLETKSLNLATAQDEVLQFLRNNGISPEIYTLQNIHKALSVLNRNIVMNNILMLEQIEILKKIQKEE